MLYALSDIAQEDMSFVDLNHCSGLAQALPISLRALLHRSLHSLRCARSFENELVILKLQRARLQELYLLRFKLSITSKFFRNFRSCKHNIRFP